MAPITLQSGGGDDESSPCRRWREEVFPDLAPELETRNQE